MLKLVEIELHSYCNRTCNWCPNNFIDRRSVRYQLSEKIFESVIAELAEMKFDGTISFSRYNEPLSDIELLSKRIAHIRKVLPEVKLVTNTNGDYLNTLDFDIDELSIMDYDCKGVYHWAIELLNLGAELTYVTDTQLRAIYGKMLILVELDWATRKVIEDRGNSLTDNINWKNDHDLRDRPCYEPISFIGINYDGTVSPCCNIRSDFKPHEKYILGDLNITTLFEILNSKDRSEFIDKVTIGNFPEPCIRCQKDAGRYTKDNGGIYS